MKIIGIYKIISPNNKIYIGQSNNILNRWKYYNSINCKNQTYLYHSLKKYGVKKHKFEIICQCDESELNNLEKYYIGLFQTFNSEYGMNLREGGNNGGKQSKETILKRIENRRRNGNYIMSEETRKKISDAKKGKSIGEKNHFFGKKHSEETKQKMREKRLGKSPVNKGIKQQTNTGRTHFKRGVPSWNKGKRNAINEQSQ